MYRVIANLFPYINLTCWMLLSKESRKIAIVNSKQYAHSYWQCVEYMYVTVTEVEWLTACCILKSHERQNWTCRYDLKWKWLRMSKRLVIQQMDPCNGSHNYVDLNMLTYTCCVLTYISHMLTWLYSLFT